VGGNPQAARGQVLQKWARQGIVIPQLERILKRADPAFQENFQNAATLYEQLRKVSPKYADTVAGGEAAAMLDQYLYDTRRSGQSHQEAARVLTQPKREVEEARSVINDTWKSGIKDYLEIDGKPRDPRELHRIRQEAERIASRGGVSGEAAIRAAVGQIDAQRTTVNGRRVPNIGMPQGAEPAVDELIQTVARKLGRDPDELSALPNPRNPGQWQIVGPDNWLIPDRTPAAPSVSTRVPSRHSTSAGRETLRNPRRVVGSSSAPPGRTSPGTSATCARSRRPRKSLRPSPSATPAPPRLPPSSCPSSTSPSRWFPTRAPSKPPPPRQSPRTSWST
jgi:hypothetical protein